MLYVIDGELVQAMHGDLKELPYKTSNWMISALAKLLTLDQFQAEQSAKEAQKQAEKKPEPVVEPEIKEE